VLKVKRLAVEADALRAFGAVRRICLGRRFLLWNIGRMPKNFRELRAKMSPEAHARFVGVGADGFGAFDLNAEEAAAVVDDEVVAAGVSQGLAMPKLKLGWEAR
jgi:hypothetical protein